MFVRRPHKKSRQGCTACKKRHIKCDELQPECSNCVHYRSKCKYLVARNAPSRTPRSDSHHIPPSSTEIAACVQIPYCRPVSIADSTALASWHPYDPTSLELLHHYITTVCKTFSTDTLRQNIWQLSVVQIGFENEFVLHGILAISALHLAHIKRHDWKRYLFLAASYQNEGLVRYRRILDSSTEYERPQSLFIYACLINLYAFSMRRFEQLSGLEDAVQMYLGCANLIRGIATLLIPRRDAILKDDLSRLVNLHPPESVLPANGGDHSILVPRAVDDWHRNLFLLRERCRAELCICTRNIYLQLIEDLEKNIEYMAVSTIDESIQPLAVALSWAGNNSEEYQALLKRKEPLAAVILAWYAVLLHQADFFWCFHGWGRYLVEGIAQELEESHRELLSWPKMMVGLF